MSQLEVVLAVDPNTDSPDNQTFDHYEVTMNDASGTPQVKNSTATTVTFDNPAPGSGTVLARMIDTAGNPMLSSFSGSFVIPPAAVKFPAITSVTLNVK